MAHKKSLEALDQSLRHLRGNSKPCGSTLILLAGDSRQTLPIIPRSTPADKMNACLKNSNLWAHVKTLKLTTNMRVRLQNDDSGQTFSDQLLAIGNGKLPVDSISGRIQLPAELRNLVTSKNELVEKVFPNILTKYKNHKWLSERVIPAAKNKDVQEIKSIILTKIRNQAALYKSVDTVLEPNEAVNYPSEFLNSLHLPRFSPQVLQIKIGLPIILLRNVNPPKLCNGTRLAVKKQKKTMENVIEATILTGPFEGEAVLISRIPMIPTDLPFQFKRLQFPIRLAFTITINKAQGQSLEKCDIDLNTDCFYHGQLYVACSKVGKPDNLFICTDNGTAKNVVYSQVLRSKFVLYLSIYLSI